MKEEPWSQLRAYNVRPCLRLLRDKVKRFAAFIPPTQINVRPLGDDPQLLIKPTLNQPDREGFAHVINLQAVPLAPIADAGG